MVVWALGRPYAWADLSNRSPWYAGSCSKFRAHRLKQHHAKRLHTRHSKDVCGFCRLQGLSVVGRCSTKLAQAPSWLSFVSSTVLLGKNTEGVWSAKFRKPATQIWFWLDRSDLLAAACLPQLSQFLALSAAPLSYFGSHPGLTVHQLVVLIK